MSYLFDNFFSLTLTGLTLGAVYGLVALGYTLVYGVLRLINFAHSEVFMYGTFAALWAVMLLGGRSGAGVGVGGPVGAGHAGGGDDHVRRDRGGARAVRLPAAAQTQRPAPDRADLGHRRLASCWPS